MHFLGFVVDELPAEVVSLIVALYLWMIVPCPEQGDDLEGTVLQMQKFALPLLWNRKRQISQTSTESLWVSKTDFRKTVCDKAV